MKLTRAERWILSNQFTILAKLSPEEADSYNQMRKVVERGFTLHYDWISEHIAEDEVSEDRCKEVMDILEMFSMLKYGYDALTDKSDVDDTWVRFPGFDGNNEGDHYAYTRFLIDDEERFQNLDRGDNFNSHAPLLGRYRSMLSEWEQSGDKFNLTKEDIVRITSV